MATFQEVFPKYLHTSRLTLQLFDYSQEFYQSIIDISNTPTALARMGDFGIRTPKDVDSLCFGARLHDPRFVNGIADGEVIYMIREGPQNPGGPVVGMVSLAQRTVQAGSEKVVLPADFGWSMLEGHMGKGYATEAARELMRTVRDDLGIRDTIVFASENNPASNRVAEKLGFVEGGKGPSLDQPGKMRWAWIQPGMKRLDDVLSRGTKFGLDH